MPGPLATVARVRELGGLDDADAFQLFRLANDAALVTRITTEIAIASAWLSSRGGADYASGDATKDTLFGEAEAYLALQQLYETLKMRKVTGTHFPYDQEGSERFEELIDVEMPEHIRKFIEPYLVIEEKGETFAAPAFVLTPVLDRTTIQSASGELDDTLIEANALTDPPAA